VSFPPLNGLIIGGYRKYKEKGMNPFSIGVGNRLRLNRAYPLITNYHERIKRIK
jgi:hypothetical protein